MLDLDGDGDFDLVPSRHHHVAWPIMRNNGDGTFTEVFPGTLPLADRHGCIAADFGSTTGGAPDGRPDLYCVEGACQGSQFCEKENDLVFNLPSGGFSANLSKARRVADIHGRGRDAVAADFNGDGLMDIAVVNAWPSFYRASNRLFLNSANGVFRTVTGSPVTFLKNSYCVAAGDLTGDGRPELVVCSGKRTLTYRNVNGAFVDATSTSSYQDEPSIDIEIVDFDGDGRKDLLLVQPTQLSIWLNAPVGLPVRPSYVRAISAGRDVAVGDVNLDGKAGHLRVHWPAQWQGRAGARPDAAQRRHRRRLPQHTDPAGDRGRRRHGDPDPGLARVRAGRLPRHQQPLRTRTHATDRVQR